jgi:hypothetical protein
LRSADCGYSPNAFLTILPDVHQHQRDPLGEA